MNKYHSIIPNDVVNGHGVCVSFWVQGCVHHCPNCFNPETWDFKEGKDYTEHTKWEIIEDIGANGLQRNFSVLGGEPLAPQNLTMTAEVIKAVRNAYPNIEIVLWTGYTFNELLMDYEPKIQEILSNIDFVVDGPFIEEEKDLSLQWRGSKNQHIWKKFNNEWIKFE